MARLVDHQQYRELLMDGTVRAGAKYDLSGITNQSIAEMSGQSEPYIYRYFLDRDDLIRKAFYRSDENFFAELAKNAPILSDKTLSPRKRFHKYMNTLWDYMAADYDYCKFYVRYYYSNANTAQFREEHRAIGRKFYTKVAHFFKDDIDVDRVMHSLFTTVLWSVMDEALGISRDTPEARAERFDDMFRFLAPYFRKG